MIPMCWVYLDAWQLYLRLKTSLMEFIFPLLPNIFFPLNFLFLRMTPCRYSSPNLEISSTLSLALPSHYFCYQSLSLFKLGSPTSSLSFYLSSISTATVPLHTRTFVLWLWWQPPITSLLCRHVSIPYHLYPAAVLLPCIEPLDSSSLSFGLSLDY